MGLWVCMNNIVGCVWFNVGVRGLMGVEIGGLKLGGVGLRGLILVWI